MGSVEMLPVKMLFGCQENYGLQSFPCMKGEARSHPTLSFPRPISGILKSESTNSVLRMRTKAVMWPPTKGKLSPRLHRRVSSQLQPPLPGQLSPPSCILPGCKSGVLSKNFPLSFPQELYYRDEKASLCNQLLRNQIENSICYTSSL